MADAPYKIFGVHPSKLRAVSGTSLVDISPFVNAFTMNFNLTQLTFQYNGTQDQVSVGQALTGTIGMGKFNTAILDSVVGVSSHTTGIAAVSKFWHPETGTYPYCQAEIHVRVQDDANNGAETDLVIIVWKLKLQNPYAPGNIGNLEANTQTLQWSATATTTDVLGNAIPNVGSTAITYTVGVAA